MFTSLFEIFSSVFTMGLSFFILFLLPWLIIIFEIVSCIRKKRENKPIKKQILISSILELILIILIVIFYYNVEDSKFLFLVVFLCGGFSLLITILVALPIICVYQRYKKTKTSSKPFVFYDKEELKGQSGDGSLIDKDDTSNGLKS